MNVAGIYVASDAGGPLIAVDQVRAVPGKGLVGDRYFSGMGTFSAKTKSGREITLIERESIDAIARESDIQIDPGETRRNIVTEGVALNHLVERKFKLGEVEIWGERLCEPCTHLENLTVKGVREALVHRGGLRGRILTEGVIKAGDPVVIS